MSQEYSNPYETPAAELVTSNNQNSILEFKRFTAWGVFGLTIITLGFYPLYWLYTRALVANSVHSRPISQGLLVTMLVTTILSVISSFYVVDETMLMVNSVLSLIYIIVYITVLFKVRNRLKDILNESNEKMYGVNPVFTLFLSSIYLQYKINKGIDDCQQTASS